MTDLYFVRHAHSIYTPDERERPLSPEGWAAAKQVTDALMHEPIDAVISSPYKRAMQTVEGTAAHFHLPIHIEEDLRERLLSPHVVHNFMEAMELVWKQPEYCLSGGESNVSAQARGVACILQILQEYEGKRVVIGTHGNIMVLIMNYFHAACDYSFWKSLHMPDIYKLSFSADSLQNLVHIPLR